MNKKLITSSALAGLVLAGGIAGMVSAQSAADTTGLSEEQIIEIALAEVPGEVSEVEQERHGGQAVYEVEILAADGTETEMKIAADTGDILKVEADGEDCDKDGEKHGGKYGEDRDDDDDGDDDETGEDA